MSENVPNSMILTALTLVLGRQIKAEKAGRGHQTTSDCSDEALRLITQKHDQILTLLQQR